MPTKRGLLFNGGPRFQAQAGGRRSRLQNQPHQAREGGGIIGGKLQSKDGDICRRDKSQEVTPAEREKWGNEKKVKKELHHYGAHWGPRSHPSTKKRSPPK